MVNLIEELLLQLLGEIPMGVTWIPGLSLPWIN